MHYRTLGFHLATDQLEGLGDGHGIVDSRGHLQGFDLVAASAAHGGDDGAFRAARDVRLVAGFADAFNHMRDLWFRGFLRHVDDHKKHSLSGIICDPKYKSRDPDRGLRFKTWRDLGDFHRVDLCKPGRSRHRKPVAEQCRAQSKSRHRCFLNRYKIRVARAFSQRQLDSNYWMELATFENALFAFVPISRTVPTTRTRITASI